MLKINLNKVKEKWELDGLNLAEPLSENGVNDSFTSLKISVSKDVIEVFSNLNGFDENGMDSECLSFWTIEKILRENETNSEYVYFADFLIDSHHYAFKFENADFSSIHIHFSETLRFKIADSFGEFFELYLNNPENLFR